MRNKRARSQFTVVYKLVSIKGEKVKGTKWRDYYRRTFLYQVACEMAEQARWSQSGSSDYDFKVVHQKLMKEGELV